MEQLGVAVIGCGSVARWKYGENLSALDGVSVRAVFGGAAEDFRLRYGSGETAVCLSLEELLARRDVDAVFVCTPNRSHGPISLAALEAGKHVLCEKPMAVDEADAAAMVRAARARGLVLTVGHQARFTAAARSLRRAVESGRLGRPYFARASMVRRMGIPTWGHFFDPAVQGGGCLMDLGTHALDLALWLLDDFTPVYCCASTFRGPGDHPTAANRWGPWDPAALKVETSAFAQVVLSGGAAVSIDTSWALHVPRDREETVTVCGTEAGGELFPGGWTLSGVRDDRLVTRRICLPEDEQEANRAQLSDFVDAVRRGRDPLVTPEQSLSVARILSGLYRSAREQRPIIW